MFNTLKLVKGGIILKQIGPQDSILIFVVNVNIGNYLLAKKHNKKILDNF